MTNPWLLKAKVVNDPVYGFISLPGGITAEVVAHPYFQRLRRIRQLGLTYLVYPGASHTRFQHALGAMHLMTQALGVLSAKGCPVSEEEMEAARLAILLHDIGHGPFSHSLETTIVRDLDHEMLSRLFFEKLDHQFGGALHMAYAIFTGSYPRKFLHQLVESQLDTDRLDYLRRDSFFTGVTEGSIGSDRLIKMFGVVDEQLAVEEKALYSIEQFLIARRFMYWQVYYHKTVVSAELMLIRILERARDCVARGGQVFSTPALRPFLSGLINGESFARLGAESAQPDALDLFAALDDTDVLVSIKEWQHADDRVLAGLSRRLINRDLMRLHFLTEPVKPEKLLEIRDRIATFYHIPETEADYFLFSESISKNAYNRHDDEIKLILQDGRVEKVSLVSDIIDFDVFGQPEKKFILAFPKDIGPVLL